MEKVHATTFLEITVTCPYCGAYDDKIDELREYLQYGELTAESIDAEVSCSECEQKYIIEQINY